MLQRLKKQEHRCAIHKKGKKQECANSLAVQLLQAVKVEWLYPYQQRNACYRGSDVTENQNFDFREGLHQALAVHVVKRRTETTSEDEQVARQESHGSKRCLTKITQGKKNNSDQTDRKRSDSQCGKTLSQHQRGQHRTDHRNQEIENGAVRCKRLTDAPGHAELR